MNTTLQPTGRRAGATCVAATGAFLLVAAAALFVAVRWDHLTQAAKFGVIVAVTGACIAGGRRVRPALPATGEELFHLGAFLLPVDLAAYGLHADLGWRTLLVAEGVLGVVALGGLGIVTRSVVLTWAGSASMLLVTAGVAGLTPVPATSPWWCWLQPPSSHGGRPAPLGCGMGGVGVAVGDRWRPDVDLACTRADRRSSRPAY